MSINRSIRTVGAQCRKWVILRFQFHLGNIASSRPSRGQTCCCSDMSKAARPGILWGRTSRPTGARDRSNAEVQHSLSGTSWHQQANIPVLVRLFPQNQHCHFWDTKTCADVTANNCSPRWVLFNFLFVVAFILIQKHNLWFYKRKFLPLDWTNQFH